MPLSFRSKTAPSFGRSIPILVGAQGIYILAVSIVFSFSSIVSTTAFGQDRFSTLPLTILTISAALTIFPVSTIIQKYGQRAGFVTGTLSGAVGAATCAWAIIARDFSLYNFGHVGLGVFQASAMYYRFAAADAAGETNAPAQARAISWVIAGGLGAALIGPELAAWTRTLSGTDYVGSFVAVVVLLTLGAGVLSIWPAPAGAGVSRASVRSLLPIIRDRRFLVAALNASVAYIIMSYVMSAAPLAVTVAGHGADTAAAITRWHLIGMFAPSFFAGRLVKFLGIPKMLLFALALLVVSAGIGAASTDLMFFRISLFGLGVGWNLLFIGATTLLAANPPAGGQAQVRAANDFIVLSAAAAATFAAGALHSTFGWMGINLSVLPVVALAGMATLWMGEKTKKGSSNAPSR